MAHELDFTTGTAGIAIRHDGKTPWHGYGQRLPDDATLDQWRVAAQLDWSVDERTVYYSTRSPEGKNLPTPITNRKALVRTDSQDCLAVVGNKYHVVQPEQILEFYRDLIEANGFTMDTAGALMGGRRIWALASMGESTRIYGQDKIDGYVLLATSYDGTLATTAQFTSVRVVCNNTLEFATGNQSAGTFKASHKAAFDPDEAKGALGLSREAWERYESQVNTLANTHVDLDTALAFFTTVLGKDAITVNDEGKPEYSPTFHKMFAAYERSPGAELRSAHHTAWGLVNAVTYYQDHMAKSSKQGSRLNSAWFGQGANRKAKAFETALELAA